MTSILLTNSRHTQGEARTPEPSGGAWGDRTYMRIIQYVPNELRDERINVAIVLQNPSHDYAGMRVRPYMDTLLLALWPSVDAEIIRLMIREIEEVLKPLNKSTRKATRLLVNERHDERSLPTYLDRFNQSYGSLRITEMKPVLVEEGESFKEKLNQLFELYIRIDDGRQKRSNITKEVIQFQVGKELDRLGTAYVPHMVITGEHFENKFDLARHRIDRIGTLAHIISIDLKALDPAVTQSMRLLKSLDDLNASDPNFLKKYEFGVFLQAPVHYRQHRDEYDNALRAFRKGFKIFQNVGDEPDLNYETEKFVNGIASDEGFSAA
jgi:hypothetical protein